MSDTNDKPYRPTTIPSITDEQAEQLAAAFFRDDDSAKALAKFALEASVEAAEARKAAARSDASRRATERVVIETADHVRELVGAAERRAGAIQGMLVIRDILDREMWRIEADEPEAMPALLKELFELRKIVEKRILVLQLGVDLSELAAEEKQPSANEAE